MCSASAKVTSIRSCGPSPRSASIASATSRALPTARPSGASIRVTSARVRTPCSSPSATMVRARSSARSRSCMNAPAPVLTSSTSAPVPSAIFLDMIELAMSGIDSTVPVTSRSAYSLRSAGARPVAGRGDHRADVRQRGGQLVVAEGGAPAGDRLELVQGAAGVPEAAPRQHRHHRAAARHQRRQHQRDLVPDAAGGVLVDRRSGAPARRGVAETPARGARATEPACAARAARPPVPPPRFSRSPESIIAPVQARSSAPSSPLK